MGKRPHPPLSTFGCGRTSAGFFAGGLALLCLWAGCSAPATAPANTALTRAQHSVNFEIATGSHAALDCNDCHGAGDSFRDFSCTGCHTHEQAATDAAHLGITPGYTYSATSCYQCHGPGKTWQFDHTYFPIRTGDVHQGLACLDCHQNNADRTQVNCLSCHPAQTTDPLHTDVGGYAQDSKTCLHCHADSQVHDLDGHTPFAIDPHAPHYKVSCYACHDTPRVDKPYGQDFSLFNCPACHAQSDLASSHSGLAGYQYQSTTCVTSGCHQNGKVPGG